MAGGHAGRAPHKVSELDRLPQRGVDNARRRHRRCALLVPLRQRPALRAPPESAHDTLTPAPLSCVSQLARRGRPGVRSKHCHRPSPRLGARLHAGIARRGGPGVGLADAQRRAPRRRRHLGRGAVRIDARRLRERADVHQPARAAERDHLPARRHVGVQQRIAARLDLGARPGHSRLSGARAWLPLCSRRGPPRPGRHLPASDYKPSRLAARVCIITASSTLQPVPT